MINFDLCLLSFILDKCFYELCENCYFQANFNLTKINSIPLDPLFLQLTFDFGYL